MNLKALLKKILPGPVLHLIYVVRSFSLVRGRFKYRQDGLYTMHAIDFLEEPKFVEAYALGRQAGIFQDSKIHYRAWVACWAGLKARTLPGDYVECGVYRGALSRMVMHYADFKNLSDKKFYLVDTFAGIPAESISAEEKLHGRLAGVFDESYEAVRETFREFDNVRIVRGKVPEVLQEVPAQKVCYLSLDMNCAEPEIAAAEYFWPKMVSGAVMVLDDYGFDTHEVQKRMFDEFAERQRVKILPMPTGQGLLFKP